MRCHFSADDDTLNEHVRLGSKYNPRSGVASSTWSLSSLIPRPARTIKRGRHLPMCFLPASNSLTIKSCDKSLFPSACSLSLLQLLSPRTQQRLDGLKKLDPAFRCHCRLHRKNRSPRKWLHVDRGSAWVEDDRGGHLLFSDIPRNSIFRWSEKGGTELFMSPSGYTGATYYGLEPGSNGLTLDPQGRLTACEHGDRRISVLTKGGGKRIVG